VVRRNYPGIHDGLELALNEGNIFELKLEPGVLRAPETGLRKQEQHHAGERARCDRESTSLGAWSALGPVGFCHGNAADGS
jgi:hypothetical protein